MPAARQQTLVASISALLMVVLAVAGSAGSVPSPDKPDHEAPSAPTNIRVTASTLTTASLGWDSSTDNVEVAGYYVYPNYDHDNGKRDRVSTTEYAVTDLDCGESTTVWIAAYDSAMNRSKVTAATFSTAACSDTEAPTPPEGFRQAATTQTAVVLEWNRSSDNVGVVGYGVYRNQLPVQSSSEPTATLTGFVCGSTYEFQFDAADASGNRSERRSAWVQTAQCSVLPPPPPADTTPPAQPANLRVTGVAATTVSLTWDPATDNVGVAGYDVYQDGVKMTHVTSTSSIQGDLACGSSYSFGVEAVDGAGNRSARVSTNATTTACQTSSTGWTFCATETQQCTFAGTKEVRYGQNGTFTAPRVFSNTVWCGNATFGDPLPGTFKRCESRDLGEAPPASSYNPSPDQSPPSQPANLAVASVTRTSVSLTWGASTDNVGVTEYGVYVNGNSVTTLNQLDATVSALTCGTAFTFAVDAADAANNRSTRAQVTASTAACTDGQAPTAPTNVVASSRTATSIALTWSGSTDNVGVTGYGLYRGGALTGTSATTTGIFSGLTCNTNYTLAVDAFDADGNRSGKTTVMVATTGCSDTAAPSSPTGLAVSNVTESSLTLTWNASTDNVGVTGYDVFRNGSQVASGTSTSVAQSALACGTLYWFGVVAYDGAGNRSSKTSVSAATSACPPPPAPPPSSSRHVYCFGDPAYGAGGWLSDGTSNGSIRQGYAATLAQRVVYDTSVDVMGSLGCKTVKAEIRPQDPDANGGTANQRAQLYMQDSLLDRYGSQPSLDAAVGKTSWYGFAFATNSGYVPHYDPMFGNWNSIFSWHNAPIGGVWGHLANVMLEVATIGPTSGTEYKCGAPSTRLSQPRLHIQLNGGDQADPNWPNEDGRLTCRRYLGPVFEPGRKYRVEMLIKWGAYMDGSLQVWIDGTKYVDAAGISNVWYSGSTVDAGIYPVFENYRAYDTTLPTNIVYYGGLVKGSTQSDVRVP